MRKKVFFMIPSLAGGGAERVFVNLVNKINKKEFDITLIYLSDEKNVYDVSNDVRVINLDVKRVRNAPFKIIKLVRKEEPDLIFSTLAHLNIMLLILKFTFRKNTKIIVRQTNIMSLNKSEKNSKQILKNTLSKFYKKADKIICQSNFMKKDFISTTNIKKNVVKIYNPVDIDLVSTKAKENIEYTFDENEKKIFFVGRLDKVKRIPLIIDAFKKYHLKNNQSALYILGEGPEKKSLENYIQKHNLNSCVKLLGFKKNPYKWLSHADLFMMASKHEGMPNILLESLALKIPVLILKHTGGTEDIMMNLEIEDRFTEDFHIKEKHFLEYNNNIDSKLEEKFSIDNIILEYEKAFRETLESN